MAPTAMLAPPAQTHVSALRGSRRFAAAQRRLASNEEGSLNISKGLAIVGIVIGAVVTMAIVAALFPTFMGSVADVNAVFTDENTTTGDPTADSLLTIFPILIGLGALFAIVGVVLLAVQVGKAKGL